mgnify:CR=1 FL=1|jgi:hypothetical protein
MGGWDNSYKYQWFVSYLLFIYISVHMLYSYFWLYFLFARNIFLFTFAIIRLNWGNTWSKLYFYFISNAYKISVYLLYHLSLLYSLFYAFAISKILRTFAYIKCSSFYKFIYTIPNCYFPIFRRFSYTLFFYAKKYLFIIYYYYYYFTFNIFIDVFVIDAWNPFGPFFNTYNLFFIYFNYSIFYSSSFYSYINFLYFYN